MTDAIVEAAESAIGQSPAVVQDILDGLIKEGCSVIDLLRFALTLKESGEIGPARNIIHHLTTLDHGEPAVLYELGVLQLLDDVDAALETFSRALQINREFYHCCAIFLLVGELLGDVSVAHTARMLCDNSLLAQIRSDHAAFFRYAHSVSENSPWMRHSNRGLFELPGYPSRSMDQIIDLLSISGNSQNRLIQLGDHEGAMFVFGGHEEALLADLYSANRQRASRRACGEDFFANAALHIDIQASIAASICDNSVLAFPSAPRLMKMLTGLDLPNFSTNFNAVRKAMDVIYASDCSSPLLCEADLDSQAEQLAMLQLWIRGRKHVSLVTIGTTEKDCMGFLERLSSDIDVNILPLAFEDVEILGNGMMPMSTADACKIARNLSGNLSHNAESVILACGPHGRILASALNSKGRDVFDINNLIQDAPISSEMPIA